MLALLALVGSSIERLDADLCYMNQLFMWNFICCTMAHNENRRGQRLKFEITLASSTALGRRHRWRMWA